MLYWISAWLAPHWGPFRLLASHLLLLALGTSLAAALVLWRLPLAWETLPRDRGKTLTPDGKQSEGKPTGAGILVARWLLPAILLFAPLDRWGLGVVGCLYLSMWFGYLDDRSELPWGQLKKGLLDLLVAGATAFLVCKGEPATLWLPFYKGVLTVPVWLYLPFATLLLFITTNTTNCSDGIDGLAGSLSLISLFSLALFLYVAVGHQNLARYLLIPPVADGARWAILLSVVGGGFAGYLWYNAFPSQVLMGDAGSRFLGLLIGVAVLVSGNPFMALVTAPVLLVNGGGGLAKLILLRLLRRLGFDVRPEGKLTAGEADRRAYVVKALHGVRWPLHDHCRKVFHWSPAQVLVRFVLIQLFLVPLLFVLLVKVR
ncbi:MAG: phospho-N-acetylmuramoyl-pentapeptide-transferase [Kiritimatiellia bacterium]|nr:phospho-N-acetylmuramoyl-pentapeptide-transferase [Kiritimatiellia bacterium]